jgi:hypothetical protein
MYILCNYTAKIYTFNSLIKKFPTHAKKNKTKIHINQQIKTQIKISTLKIRMIVSLIGRYAVVRINLKALCDESFGLF